MSKGNSGDAQWIQAIASGSILLSSSIAFFNSSMNLAVFSMLSILDLRPKNMSQVANGFTPGSNCSNRFPAVLLCSVGSPSNGSGDGPFGFLKDKLTIRSLTSGFTICDPTGLMGCLMDLSMQSFSV